MNSEAAVRTASISVKDSYIQAYLGEKEASRFLHERQSGKPRGKLRFDPFAFLFSFFYCFVKKMYREFAVLLAISAILPLAVGLIAGIISVRSEWGYEDAGLSEVFEEFSEPPVVYYHETFSGCLRDPGGFFIYNDHSFRFHTARLGTLTVINIFCGLSFSGLYKRKTEREILKQLSLIKTDDEAAREDILRKAGRELKRPDIGNVFAFLLWVAFVPVPFIQAAYASFVSYFLM